MSASSNDTSSSDDENTNNSNDYDIIGVRQTIHNTSYARRHSALNVHERIDLKALEEAADNLLSIRHHIDLLIILTFTAIAKLRSGVTTILVKMCHTILALLALCEDELDVLSELEVDIRALCPEDRPPLQMYPIKNRRIDDLDANFAYQYTQFSKAQLRQLYIYLRLPTTVFLPRR